MERAVRVQRDRSRHLYRAAGDVCRRVRGHPLPGENALRAVATVFAYFAAIPCCRSGEQSVHMRTMVKPLYPGALPSQSLRVPYPTIVLCGSELALKNC